MSSTVSIPQAFDRTLEDLGNIVQFGHLNLTVPDHRLATAFYISGLGLTRDPYLMTGCENMWVNVGQEQLHLPVYQPQLVGGTIGLVVPDIGALWARLAGLCEPLAATCFAFLETSDGVRVICPWGNRFHCHAPDVRRFGRMRLGIAYLELDVQADCNLAGIVRFYRRILGAQCALRRDRSGPYAWVALGAQTRLLFRRARATPVQYDGHHIQITLANFSAPYRKLLERGLITEESNQHQYRFRNIIDPETGAVLVTLEHEVRSMRHPLYGRALTNRNPAQRNDAYVPGWDSISCTLSVP